VFFSLGLPIRGPGLGGAGQEQREENHPGLDPGGQGQEKEQEESGLQVLQIRRMAKTYALLTRDSPQYSTVEFNRYDLMFKKVVQKFDFCCLRVTNVSMSKDTVHEKLDGIFILY
jgi:hypothetical protein